MWVLLGNTTLARRWAILAAVDVAVWVVAFVIAAVISTFTSIEVPGAVANAAVVGVAAGLGFVAVGSFFRLHQGRAPIGSFEEAVWLSVTASVIGALTLAADLAFGAFYRGLVAVSAPAYALVLMLLYRGFARAWWDRQLVTRATTADDRQRVVIMGAGNAGMQLVRSMLPSSHSAYLPVAFVDDSSDRKHLRLYGVRVEGTFDDLAEVAAAHDATMAIVALPTADAATMRRVVRLAEQAGVALRVLPQLDHLVDPAHVDINDVRDIDVTDLLGRHQIVTDVEETAGYITGKRVLVTGAGGSIGSELSRQLYRFGPAELMMLDRDESALHTVELSIHGRATLDTPETILCNIRDAAAVNRIFEERRPEVVFHAAALKHQPLLERYPSEAIQTNVWGTLNVLEASRAVGVERFVNISTDKAANPVNVLGFSKRLAEGLTASFTEDADGTYMSVRFGNVLGSRGSVLTAFAKQIADGGPVTVTHPDVTRFFMTIPEAVQLVIQAAAIGQGGEAMVLDMGDPVKIDDVAKQLISMSGKEIRIVYTGLRPGEKMHEDLFGDIEGIESTEHELINRAAVPAVAPGGVRELPQNALADELIDALRTACRAMLTEPNTAGDL